jgi:serine/threonine protein kinase
MPILGTGDDWYIMPIASTSLADKAPDLYEPELMKALSQVAAGLAQAHAKGLVHRDVKPSNILLLTDNANTRWVIGDFGLVRRPLGQTTALATSRPLGTPEFMAPEAFAGIHKVGPTADVYSLGKTLLWALTGRTDGEGPKDWEELIAAMTAPHVDDRVPSMAEFQVRLAKVGESLRQQRRTVWGQPALSLSDDEVEVLEAILSTMQIRPGDDSPSATLTQLERECHTLTLGGIRLQVTRLVGKDLIWEGSHPDSWGIAAAGWRWLRSNQHRLHLKKPPPDSDIPF